MATPQGMVEWRYGAGGFAMNIRDVRFAVLLAPRKAVGIDRRTMLTSLILTAALASSARAGTGERALISALQSGKPARAGPAADYVIAHPDAVPPASLAKASQVLWQRGDRAQSAFWQTVYRIRIRPWAQYNPNLLRALTVEDQVHDRIIDMWLQSDLAPWRDLTERALGYEARAPLYAGKPVGVSQADWLTLNEQMRVEYDAIVSKRFDALTPETLAESRAQQGLYAGPWKEPGAPLPDDWR